MQGPQLKDGYTRIANEILEIIYGTNFNATQFKIILCIIRYTYGFNRKSHEISVTFLSNATGISKRYISSELKKLIDNKVITIVKSHSDTSSRILMFNKKYTEWQGYKTIIPQMNNTSPGEELVSTTDEELFIRGDEGLFSTAGEELFTQERQYKDNTTTITMGQSPEDENLKDNNLVAQVGADPTKHDAPLRELENYYLTHVRKRTMSSSADLIEMVHAYETYKDLDFILNVIQAATSENIKRNGKCKINSFSYFTPILQERWEEKMKIKEGRADGTDNSKPKSNPAKTYRFTEEDAERAGVTSL